MDKKELEHKLEQARKDRELATAEANKEIEALKAQLAEAEKPVKLRLGDVIEWTGKNCTNKGVNVIYGPRSQNGDLRQYNLTEKSDGVTNEYPPDEFTKHFNILKQADDLKEMSEPLKSFSVDNGDINVSFDVDGDLRIEQGDDTILISEEFKAEFGLKYRRMLAWKLAQEAKSK